MAEQKRNRKGGMQSARHFYTIEGRRYVVYQISCSLDVWQREKTKLEGAWSPASVGDGMVIACRVNCLDHDKPPACGRGPLPPSWN